MGSGMGKWLVGDVDTDEEGENVGKGEVDLDGCSSIWLESVLVTGYRQSIGPL